MIKLINVTLEYETPLEKKTVLNNINLELNKNSIVVILGGSGSGKSTLLDILTLNNLGFKGSYYYKNNNIKAINIETIKKRIVYLNQGQALFGKLNALDNTKLINSKIIGSLFEAVLFRFGLGRIKRKNVELLSGGEKQRVGIVRSISKSCELLVLDEPTSNLDLENKNNFIAEINKFKSEKLVIIATHDKDLLRIADIIVDLDNTRLTYKKINNKKDFALTSKNHVSKNSVINLVIKDLFTNKKRLLLFISAMSNGLLGLLMGFVIVSGFESMFISVLVDQEVTDLSVVYPSFKSNLAELEYQYVYLSDRPITISSDYLNFVDDKIDLINSSQIDDKLVNNQIILFLSEDYYAKYQLNASMLNTKELILKYNNKIQKLQVISVIRSDKNSIKVSTEFKDIVINGLGLAEIYKKTKVLNLMINNPADNVAISQIASTHRLSKKNNYLVDTERGIFLNQFDLNYFVNYLICNRDYLIYCDLNSATAYIELSINGISKLVKVNNGVLISVSSELYKILNTSRIEVLFDDFVVASTTDYTIFNSNDLALTLPYTIFTNYLKSFYGPLIQAEYLLIDPALQSLNAISNYKVISPYKFYLESFQEILDAVFIGFLAYSLISLLLGIVTVSILTVLELDNRKKQIGTLMLLGWSSNQIRAWIVSNSMIKTILTIIITSIMIQLSINTLNLIIKEVSTILIVFNYPPLNIMLILIISLLLIIGYISLFHVNYLLKNTPKKLISEI
jgi:putative ABC transport system ATP-binding protein